MLSGLNYFQVHKHTKIHFLEKIKWNSKIYPLRIIKIILLYHSIILLYHLKLISWPSMHKWSFRTSKFTLKVLGLKFFKVHKHIKIQFLLIIIKTLFFYHLKQTSWQSMHKWSFRTSKFTPKVSGLKFV